MKLLDLINNIKKDLELKYGIPVKISTITGLNSDFFLRVIEQESKINGLGFDIYLKFRRIELKMHWMRPLMNNALPNLWKENLRNSFYLFNSFEKSLLNNGCEINFFVNEKQSTLKDALEIGDWKNIEITSKKRFVVVMDLNDYYYENFSNIISSFWGMVLSVAGNTSYSINSNEMICEGEERFTISKTYERSPINRQACILLKGTTCAVCGMNFEKKYGEIGKGFIEIHHIKPVSSYSGFQPVNPETDLVPLCPNCHAMIHKKNPPYTVEELKEIMNVNKK